MKGKLTRNTSDERWREYWKAVDSAASKAPTLRYRKEEHPEQDRRRSAAKGPSKSRKEK